MYQIIVIIFRILDHIWSYHWFYSIFTEITLGLLHIYWYSIYASNDVQYNVLYIIRYNESYDICFGKPTDIHFNISNDIPCNKSYGTRYEISYHVPFNNKFIDISSIKSNDNASNWSNDISYNEYNGFFL